MTVRQLCTFQLGSVFLGIDVKQVQEVLHRLEMTRVPLASSRVAGLINLRGQIVTAIELGECLGLAPRPADVEPMNVVVYTKDGPVSLIVDEIGDVVDVLSEDFEHTPETIGGSLQEVIEGVYKLPDRLLLVVNVESAAALACQVPTGAETRNVRSFNASS